MSRADLVDDTKVQEGVLFHPPVAPRHREQEDDRDEEQRALHESVRPRYRLGFRVKRRLPGRDGHRGEPIHGSLERPLTVHLGDDERDPVLQPVGRGLVDRDSASAHGVGDELAARRGPDREQADVEIAGAQSLGRRLLDGQTVELLSG